MGGCSSCTNSKTESELEFTKSKELSKLLFYLIKTISKYA